MPQLAERLPSIHETPHKPGVADLCFLGCKSQLYHLLVVWPWNSYLTSLTLNFFYCKTELTVLLAYIYEIP